MKPILLFPCGALTAAESVRDKAGELVRQDAERIKSQAVSAPAPPPKAGTKPEEPVVTLPEVEVRGERITPLEHEIAVLDEAQRRELRNAGPPSELDRALNSPLFSFFGGYNAEARAATARHCAELMDFERALLVYSYTAQDPEERKRLRAYLDELRAMGAGRGR